MNLRGVGMVKDHLTRRENVKNILGPFWLSDLVAQKQHYYKHVLLSVRNLGRENTRLEYGHRRCARTLMDNNNVQMLC